jgi:hypothetical protein
MALADKNIVITPNISAAGDPKIVFSGADASTAAQNITLTAYPTLNGMLSFDGSAGQLLSVTNSLTGTIFAANDVSGIPSIEVLDTGLVKLAQYGGNVLIGTGTDDGTNRLQVSSAKFSSSLVLPTTSTLPSSPAQGNLRFNTSTLKFEGYNGTVWGAIGGDNATNIAGGSANQILYQTGASTTGFLTPSTGYLNWTGSAFAWSTLSGGATLSSVAASTTYYIGLSANSTSTWTDARVDTGNLYYTSGDNTLYATNFNTASDINLKENIQKIDNSLDILTKLQGVSFNWKSTGNKSYGLIAQELETVLPELVNTVDGVKSIAYTALIGILLEAIKELNEKLENK